MPRYYVYATEVVSYIAEVEAESEQEAMQKGREGGLDFGQPTDGEGIEITGAELADEADREFQEYLEKYKLL